MVKGNVLIQTESPYNPAIQCAAEHDYKSFYEDEIVVREELQLPPFTRMIALHFDGDDPGRVQECAKSLLETLNRDYASDEAAFDELSPCVIERIKGKYRFMACIRGKNLTAVRRALRPILTEWSKDKKNRDVDFYVDADPLNLL